MCNTKYSMHVKHLPTFECDSPSYVSLVRLADSIYLLGGSDECGRCSRLD